MSIDQGNHPAAVPVVPIVSRSPGEHRPGQPSRGRARGADRRRSPGDEHRPGEASAVAVVPVVTSIDRVKRQPAPVSIIDRGNHPAAVAVLSIVAGAW